LEVTFGGHLVRSPAKQGHLQLVVQGHVQVAFEYLQGQRLHNLPEQPVPVLSHPHSRKEFPDVQMKQAEMQGTAWISCLQCLEAVQEKPK